MKAHLYFAPITIRVFYAKFGLGVTLYALLDDRHATVRYAISKNVWQFIKSPHDEFDNWENMWLPDEEYCYLVFRDKVNHIVVSRVEEIVQEWMRKNRPSLSSAQFAAYVFENTHAIFDKEFEAVQRLIGKDAWKWERSWSENDEQGCER
jgi:hypothetical protein